MSLKALCEVGNDAPSKQTRGGIARLSALRGLTYSRAEARESKRERRSTTLDMASR